MDVGKDEEDENQPTATANVTALASGGPEPMDAEPEKTPSTCILKSDLRSLEQHSAKRNTVSVAAETKLLSHDGSPSPKQAKAMDPPEAPSSQAKRAMSSNAELDAVQPKAAATSRRWNERPTQEPAEEQRKTPEAGVCHGKQQAQCLAAVLPTAVDEAVDASTRSSKIRAQRETSSGPAAELTHRSYSQEADTLTDLASRGVSNTSATEAAGNRDPENRKNNDAQHNTSNSSDSLILPGGMNVETDAGRREPGSSTPAGAVVERSGRATTPDVPMTHNEDTSTNVDQCTLDVVDKSNSDATGQGAEMPNPVQADEAKIADTTPEQSVDEGATDLVIKSHQGARLQRDRDDSFDVYDDADADAASHDAASSSVPAVLARPDSLARTKPRMIIIDDDDESVSQEDSPPQASNSGSVLNKQVDAVRTLNVEPAIAVIDWLKEARLIQPPMLEREADKTLIAGMTVIEVACPHDHPLSKFTMSRLSFLSLADRVQVTLDCQPKCDVVVAKARLHAAGLRNLTSAQTLTAEGGYGARFSFQWPQATVDAVPAKSRPPVVVLQAQERRVVYVWPQTVPIV
eukprot:TRINITY_DN7019_c0_g1_i1.p1 TRINITY_DN7019_c0_g1~~TRINITY_DN7019_c0_g1_i1.p1  ORF type:complete len:670 (+),score=133.51 TRINITY_DN7019_c0_g1_i1:288-2012(+)